MGTFYCRENELRKLNKRYMGDKFECIVIYGRLRNDVLDMYKDILLKKIWSLAYEEPL